MRKINLLVLVVLLFASTAFVYAQSTHKWKFDPTINAPWALESDQKPLDTPMAAAGLCRSNPFDTLFVYSALGSTNVDAIVGDQLNNSGFSNFGCTTAQNETTIAVNPTNANNLIAGANDYRVCCDFDRLNDGTGWAYYSLDGGATWKNVQLPGLTAETGGSGNFGLMDSAGDPVIAFSPDGVAYYANIVFSRVTFASGVAVNVSFDGGQTWGKPKMVAFESAGNFFNDKDWIAAGPNGEVVVTWTRFSQGPHGAGYLASPIVGVRSSNYGQSWNQQHFPISDDAHPFDQGSQAQIAADGTLYVAYEGGSPSTGYATDAQVLARSTDHGRTFQNVELARVYDDLDCYPIYAGRQTLTDMHFRLNSYPSMSLDSVTGKIALVWTDDQGASNCGNGGTSFSGTTSNQVKLILSNWVNLASSGPNVAVTNVTATGPDKVFPAASSYNGTVAVTYYTRDYAISSTAEVCNLVTNPNPSAIAPVPSARSVCLDYASRTKAADHPFGGQSRLSSESSNPFIQFADGSFIGDYSQVATGTDGKAHGAWTDFRGNPGTTSANQDVVVVTVP